MTDLPLVAAPLTTHFFTAADGARLAWHEVGPETGQARPLVLIHGLFSSANVNWIKYGHARLLAEAGFRVIMPDLRAHGDSAAPHDPAAYPPDVLADDAVALIRHLGLTDYDLGGYSLGGRTVLRMMIRGGVSPRRAMVLGMGLAGMLDTGHRAAFFREVLSHLGHHAQGSEAWRAEAFFKTTGGDATALIGLLGSFVDSHEAELKAIPYPTAVICGTEDQDNGSAEALARLLPQGRYIPMPGNHMNAVAKPEMGRTMRDFLLA